MPSEWFSIDKKRASGRRARCLSSLLLVATGMRLHRFSVNFRHPEGYYNTTSRISSYNGIFTTQLQEQESLFVVVRVMIRFLENCDIHL